MTDRTDSVLYHRRRHGAAQRIREEVTEGPAAGNRAGNAAVEGTGLMEQVGKARISDETFDDFLASENLLAACEEDAIKEIIADQIRDAMKVQGLTKTAMAARMKTDRRQLDRLLDPANPSVTLATLRRAAAAVGRTLRVELA
jgi:antitoxin HicB